VEEICRYCGERGTYETADFLHSYKNPKAVEAGTAAINNIITKNRLIFVRNSSYNPNQTPQFRKKYWGR
jgi:hypothetical protein